MMLTPSAKALGQCELFAGLTEEELGLIAPLCHEEVYNPGETICAEQDAAEKLYILQEGRVEIQTRLRSEAELSGEAVFEEAEPGRVFGWTALVKQQQFTATVRALDRTRVTAIRGSDLKALFDQHARIGFVVMKRLADIISSRRRQTRAELKESASASD